MRSINRRMRGGRDCRHRRLGTRRTLHRLVGWHVSLTRVLCVLTRSNCLAKPKPKPKPQDDFYIAPKPSGIANALTSFNSKSTPAALEFDGSHPGDDTKSNGGRNDDLTICEDLQLGPYTFTPPSGDPLFKTVEPHSYINLK